MYNRKIVDPLTVQYFVQKTSNSCISIRKRSASYINLPLRWNVDAINPLLFTVLGSCSCSCMDDSSSVTVPYQQEQVINISLDFEFEEKSNLQQIETNLIAQLLNNQDQGQEYQFEIQQTSELSLNLTVSGCYAFESWPQVQACLLSCLVPTL